MGNVPELDPRLAGRERVFRAPPLTEELVAAVKLISPQYDLAIGETYRTIWEADQNVCCWNEYDALAPMFAAMPKPQTILEIGPGMGRSIVFFSKKLGWEGSRIYAFEGNGKSTKYTMLGPRFEDSFCGTISALQKVLEYNGIRNVNFINAHETRLKDVKGPYDLVYSFYSVGFHWSLEHFLDDLLPLMHDRSVALFTLAPEFQSFPRLEQLPHRIIDWKSTWPKDETLRLLVLGKGTLPSW
jgi:hypothetical protein